MQKPPSTSDVFLKNEHFFLATMYMFLCKYWYTSERVEAGI